MSDLVHCLELDRGELAKGPLTAPAVVGPFDPDDDRESEFVAGGPVLAVEDVLLEQREERFHGGVVAARANAAHGARREHVRSALAESAVRVESLGERAG